MADILVLGAGVVGMTSAYALARRGHSVTVIDAGSAPGKGGASFGNGAQLSYSYTDALASPSLVRHLPKYLLGLDPAFRLRPTLSPAFWRWASAFLANATTANFERNTIEVLKLAIESRRGFAEIGGRLDFDHRQTGKLNLYSSLQAVRHAKALSQLKNAYGAQQIMLSPEQAIQREPALAGYRHSFAGALWSPLDEAGDSQRFCEALRPLLENEHDVMFALDTKVQALVARKGRLVAVRTDRGEWTCDRAVMALGLGSRDVAATVGVTIPLWPMQGYSMTIPAMPHAPAVSITDASRKIVLCRIGNRLRIAGLADIGPSVAQFSPKRFEVLLKTARSAFPDAGDYGADLNAWTGFRPMSPNSQPIIGASKVDGLFLNCGHGSLGWTLSWGAAERLAELIR